MSIEDIFYQSFTENSLIWILISVGIGGLLTATIQYLFEHSLPDWRRRRATKKAIQKYGYPLLLSAKSLQRTLERILKEPSQFKDFETKSKVNIKDDYFYLSNLYSFGSFLGWFRILEHEAFFEVSQLYEDKKLTDLELDFMDLRGEEIFPTSKDHNSLYLLSYMVKGNYYRNITLEAIYRTIIQHLIMVKLNNTILAGIPRLALKTLGDLMIVKHEETRSIVNFSDFVRSYSNDDIFRNSYSYVAELFSKIKLVQQNPSVNTLCMVYEDLQVLIEFQTMGLDRDVGKEYVSKYSHIVSPEVSDYMDWLRQSLRSDASEYSLAEIIIILVMQFTHLNWKRYLDRKKKKR